jgi:hypothetical protein
MSEAQKVYVRPDKTVVLTCPNCGHQREVLVSLFKGRRKIRVKCCKSFSVIVESRRRLRKNIRMIGNYINHSQEKNNGTCIIQDISVIGFSFSCSNFLFELGDEVTIKFTLDDEHYTEIKREAIVRNIRGNVAGCEFISGGGLTAFDGALGYYVTHVLS